MLIYNNNGRLGVDPATEQYDKSHTSILPGQLLRVVSDPIHSTIISTYTEHLHTFTLTGCRVCLSQRHDLCVKLLMSPDVPYKSHRRDDGVYIKSCKKGRVSFVLPPHENR